VPVTFSSQPDFLAAGRFTFAMSMYCATQRILGGSGGRGQIKLDVAGCVSGEALFLPAVGLSAPDTATA
jgi:hypothetical protein